MSKPDQSIPVLAIDGPSGTGKGTIASRVAGHLGWHMLDSGALYRAFAHVAVENDISPDDASGLQGLIRTIDIAFIQTDAGLKISADGTDVTDCVRSEAGGKRASIFAKIPLVRKGLLERQRRMRVAFIKVLVDYPCIVKHQVPIHQGRGFVVWIELGQILSR